MTLRVLLVLALLWHVAWPAAAADRGRLNAVQASGPQAYVGNNPVNVTDARGTVPIDDPRGDSGPMIGVELEVFPESMLNEGGVDFAIHFNNNSNWGGMLTVDVHVSRVSGTGLVEGPAYFRAIQAKKSRPAGYEQSAFEGTLLFGNTVVDVGYVGPGFKRSGGVYALLFNDSNGAATRNFLVKVTNLEGPTLPPTTFLIYQGGPHDEWRWRRVQDTPQGGTIKIQDQPAEW